MSCLAAWCAKPSAKPRSAHPQTVGKPDEREPLHELPLLVIITKIGLMMMMKLALSTTDRH
jgi:hypothetical protein